MIKMLLYILAAIFAITLVKIFIGIIMRALGAALNSAGEASAQSGSHGNRGSSQASGRSRGGTLRKDSLTGVYLAEEIAISKVINGRTHYFASEENFREYIKRTPAQA